MNKTYTGHLSQKRLNAMFHTTKRTKLGRQVEQVSKGAFGRSFRCVAGIAAGGDPGCGSARQPSPRKTEGIHSRSVCKHPASRRLQRMAPKPAGDGHHEMSDSVVAGEPDHSDEIDAGHRCAKISAKGVQDRRAAPYGAAESLTM
jgi:hypothetical protein